MLLAPITSVVITTCYDGDTCTTTSGERVRLACIDTPELRGKRADPVPAKAARDHLQGLVVAKKVGIRRITEDRYGRTVAELFLGTTNVQQEMVASGHAEIFWRYATQCPWTKGGKEKQSSQNVSRVSRISDLPRCLTELQQLLLKAANPKKLTFKLGSITSALVMQRS